LRCPNSLSQAEKNILLPEPRVLSPNKMLTSIRSISPAGHAQASSHHKRYCTLSLLLSTVSIENVLYNILAVRADKMEEAPSLSLCKLDPRLSGALVPYTNQYCTAATAYSYQQQQQSAKEETARIAVARATLKLFFTFILSQHASGTRHAFVRSGKRSGARTEQNAELVSYLASVLRPYQFFATKKKENTLVRNHTIQYNGAHLVS
jgi:hypothetical protein